MGNLYRFVEPLVLFTLKAKSEAHGYELFRDLERHALTDNAIEHATLYRTLRQLEENGHVHSRWIDTGSGPARRVYSLTAAGDQHLREWGAVLSRLASAMTELVKEIEQIEASS